MVLATRSFAVQQDREDHRDPLAREPLANSARPHAAYVSSLVGLSKRRSRSLKRTTMPDLLGGMQIAAPW